MAIRIDGKELAAKIRTELKAETEELLAQTGVQPGLAVIIVGNDPASQVYVRNKQKACMEVGYHSEKFALPEDTTREELLSLVDRLNRDPSIHGILCQLPLPRHLDANEVIAAIAPEKDVDGFHPTNVGLLHTGQKAMIPCTPLGVMEMLDRYGIEVRGKRCVVLGRSNIVGKPMAALLMQANGTVTVCHTKTVDPACITREADILVSATGSPKFLTADMVKKGAVVIDVGISRQKDGTLCGDVDFDNVEPIASAITPVPGGVGPMTIAMLLKNTMTAVKRQMK